MYNRQQQQGFWVKEWWVKPALDEIEHDGKIVQLEPKVMELLELLASKPDEVFSRTELEDTVWQGTVVGYNSLSKAITKLREALGDDIKNPHYIQTISKKGYRLIAEVRPAESQQSKHNTNNDRSIEPVTNADQATASEAKSSTSSEKVMAIAMVLITVLVIFAIIYMTSGQLTSLQDEQIETPLATSTEIKPPLNEAPVIVVLPFRNTSPKESDAYLADGITGDLITDLSRLSGIRVMSTSAVSAYKNIELSPEKARQEFNARYLLSGDVTKAGSNIRINTHLTDVEQGNILWANRYDRKFTDLFSIQDEVTQNIVQSLALKLTQKEQERIARRYTNNLLAYEYFLRGQYHLSIRTPEQIIQAREMYQKAIDLDPGFARAYAGLAISYVVSHIRGWPSDIDKPLDKALELSDRVIKLANDLPESYWVAGFVYGNLGKSEIAIEFLNKAIELNPYFADAYAMLSWINIYRGKPQQGIDDITKALQLNPAGGFLYQYQLAKAHYFMGNYDQALAHIEKTRQRNPVFIDTIIFQAVIYLHLDREEDAAWMLAEAKHNNPDFDPEVWFENLAISDEKFKSRLLSDIQQVKKL